MQTDEVMIGEDQMLALERKYIERGGAVRQFEAIKKIGKEIRF